jgi:hypothetical protein
MADRCIVKTCDDLARIGGRCQQHHHEYWRDEVLKEDKQGVELASPGYGDKIQTPSKDEEIKVYKENPPYTITQCFWVVPENDKNGNAVIIDIDDVVLVKKSEFKKAKEKIAELEGLIEFEDIHFDYCDKWTVAGMGRIFNKNKPCTCTKQDT